MLLLHEMHYTETCYYQCGLIYSVRE